jgi:uncharacterized protein YraI
MRRFLTLTSGLAALVFLVPVLVLILAPAPASAQSTGYTNGPGNLRAGPSRDYPLVATVPPGTQLSIYGCTDDWMWCDVDAGPNRGWLYARHLSYPYQGNRVVIYGHGPSLGLPIVTFSLGSYWDNYYRGRPWYGRRSYWVGRPIPPRRPGPPIDHRPGRPPGARPPHVGPPSGHRPPNARPPARPEPRPTPHRDDHGGNRGGDHSTHREAAPRRTPPR